MHRILTPLTFEKRLQTEAVTGPFTIIDGIRRRFALMIGDQQPGVDPDVIKGAMVGCNAQGVVGYGANTRSWRTVITETYRVLASPIPQAYLIPAGTMATFLKCGQKAYISAVWVVTSSNDAISNIYDTYTYHLHGVSDRFWLLTVGQLGTPMDIPAFHFS